MIPIFPFGTGGDFTIARSLRTRGTAYAGLYRNVATTTNRRKFTLSRWFKIGTVGAGFMLWQSYASSSDWASIYVHASGSLSIAQGNSGVSYFTASTSALFRDPAAWYHLVVQVDTTDATAANRLRAWINGVPVTIVGSGPGLPALNADTHFNRAGYTQGFGYEAITGWAYPTDGLHAELHFVDGTLVAPIAFGRIHSSTGAWVPIRYEGGYGGANGAFHDFRDASSAAALGLDYAGNGNHLTPAGISVAAGTNFDQSNDTPTNNHAVVNGPGTRVTDASGVALDNSNLRVTTSASAYSNSYWPLTITPQGGAYHIETIWSGVAVSGNAAVCLWRSDVVKSGIGDVNYFPTATGVLYLSNGTRSLNGSSAAYGASWASGDRIAMEWDTASGDVTFFKNGTSQGTIIGAIPPGVHYTPVIYTFNNADPRTPSFVLNAGQQPFLDVPTSGCRALSVRNLALPLIKRAAEGMHVLLDTGANIKAACEAAYPTTDFMALIKDRVNANNWQAIDTLRGTSTALQINTTAAETTYSAPSGSSAGFVWKRGAAYGFDIATYTGNAVAGTTIAHALGAVPHLMIVKSRTLATNWYVYHRNLSSAAYQLYLNLANAQDNAVTTAFNGKVPTASTFELPGAGLGSNNNGATYVAYLWTEVPGFSRIGGYTGNGSTDGPFVWCGFKPRFVMIKRADAAGAYWLIRDVARSHFNLVNLDLYPNSTDAENNASANDTDLLSNGFKLRNTGAGSNVSGGTYVFAAFAEAPFKYANAR